MARLLPLLPLLPAASSVSWAPASDPWLDEAARALLQSLRDISLSEAFVWGAFDEDIEGQHFRDYGASRGLSDVATATGGDFSGIASYDFAGLFEPYWQDYLESDAAWNSHVQAMADRGAIVHMYWHAYNPVTNVSSKDDTGSPITAILPGGSANGVWTSMLDRIASLMHAWADMSIPVIFRPFHENTGSWFWWGYSATPHEYKAAWNYTIDYLRHTKHVHNMLLAYAPSKPTMGDNWAQAYGEGPESRYPGDDRVDIVCFDHYGDDDFSAELVRDCEAIAAFAAERGKVPAICEYGVKKGVQNTDISDWHMSAFLRPVLASPACRNISFAMTWRNTDTDSYWVPLPGNLTYPSFKELHESPHTIFAGDPRLSLRSPDRRGKVSPLYV